MGLLADALLVLILLACTGWGLKKGVVKSLFSFLGFAAAALLSAALSGVLAAWIYDAFLREVFLERVSSVLTEAAPTAAAQAAALLEELPAFASNALQNQGVEALEEKLRGVENGFVADIRRPPAVEQEEEGTE